MERRSQKDPSVEEAAQVLSSLGCDYIPLISKPTSKLDLMKISSLVNCSSSSPSTCSTSTATADVPFSLRDITCLDFFYDKKSNSDCYYDENHQLGHPITPSLSSSFSSSFSSSRMKVLLPPLIIPKVEIPSSNLSLSSHACRSLPLPPSSSSSSCLSSSCLSSSCLSTSCLNGITNETKNCSRNDLLKETTTCSTREENCSPITYFSKKHFSPEKHKRFKTVTERIHLIKQRYFSKDINADIPELDNIPRLLYQIRVDVRKGPEKVGTKDIQRHLWDVKLLALFERKLIHKVTGEILDPAFRQDVHEGRLVRWRDAQIRIKIAWRQTALYQPELRPRKKTIT